MGMLERGVIRKNIDERNKKIWTTPANSSSSEYEKDSQSAIAPSSVYYKEQLN